MNRGSLHLPHRSGTTGARRRQLLESLSLAGRESSTATVMFHTAIAERAGLSASEMKTMDILARLGPRTAGELSAHTGLATNSVTSLIDRLETKGIVRRVRDPKDRRRVIVEPARGKLDGASSFFAPIQKSFEGLMEDYTDDQLATILDFLRRASERTRELTASLARARTRAERATPAVTSPAGPRSRSPRPQS